MFAVCSCVNRTLEEVLSENGAVVQLDRTGAGPGSEAHDGVAVEPVRRSVERMLLPSQRAAMTATWLSKGRMFMTGMRPDLRTRRISSRSVMRAAKPRI
jgi:hypothetical protein